MGSNQEAIALVVALLVLGYLAIDFALGRMRQRREREMVERLAGESSQEEVSAPQPGRLERRVRAAGLPGPPEAYLLAGSLIAGGVSLALLGLLPAVPLVAIVGLALTLYVEWAIVAAVARSRAARFERQLIDAIDLMTGTLAAGGSLTQSLRNAGLAAEQPLRGEFEETCNRLAMSMSIDRALARMVSRYDSEGSRLFALTIAAKFEVGGDLSTALRSLNETLRDRARQQGQVRAQLAGARLTAIGVVVLPYLVAPLLMWLQPGWFGNLFTSSLGSSLLFIAVMLQMIGILWIWGILAREL
jgi:tight adherence protein B